MKRVLAYPLSIIHYSILVVLLLLFHPVQVIANYLSGYTAHKRIVDLLNFFLTLNFYTLLCRPSFRGFRKLPSDRPLIIVANHQSMFDIPPIIWGFRKHHIKFISKKELGRNLPSISYNLKKGGSVLIDRDSGAQAIREILRLGRLMEDKKYSVCIFPEGTRSRDGVVKQFRSAGFKTLLKAAPSALVVPFVIESNYKLHRYGMFPLNVGIHLKYTVLDPIEPRGQSDEELLDRVREEILRVMSQIPARKNEPL